MTVAGGTVLRRIAGFAALAALLPLAAYGAVPPSPFTVTPPPGVYTEPQLLVFSAPPESRLEIIVDGVAYDRSQGPLFLETPADTEREWHISVIVRGAAPGSGTPQKNADLVWKIDRKRPDAPVFSSERAEAGQYAVPTLNEPGIIHWKIWHPRFAADSRGTSKSGVPVFVPSGAVLCAWGVDASGNQGSAASFTAAESETRESEKPYKIINPVPGSWSNRQSLVIERSEDLSVRYTLDGSDPAESGYDYSGPVRLEADGVVVLRILFEDTQGHAWTSKILYSVPESVSGPVSALAGSGPVTETGEFAEFYVGDGFSWGIGDGVPKEPGGKSVLFAGVRAMHTWYPLTVSDGIRSWRYVIGCGTEAVSDTVSAVNSPEQPKQPIHILDWYFVSVEGLTESFVSIDGKGWQPYSEPLFVDRDSNHRLEWYSPQWKNGAVQSLNLPAKPRLNGFPANGLTAEPVFISAADPQWELHYRSSPFILSSPARLYDPELSSGLLVEAPSGSETEYRLSFMAVCEGIVHGTFIKTFKIDRKTPRIPTLSLDAEYPWSRSPVQLTITGEDRLETFIDPEARQTATNLYALEGSSDHPVTYTIRSSGVDAAGNRGGTAEKTVTVDRNAIYVDPAWSGTRGDAPDGSPDAPYLSLDLALETIRDTGSWRIYLAGNSKLTKPHTVLADIRVIGSGCSLEFTPESFITVSSGAFRLESCSLFADLSALNKTQALITVQNGALSLNNVTVSVKGSDSAIFLRGTGSDVRVVKSELSLTGIDYAAVFDLKASKFSMDSCKVTASARSVSALSLVTTTAEVRSTSVSVVPVIASRALEAWSSALILDSVRFERVSAGITPADSAIWTDAETLLTLSGRSAFPGFKTDRETAPR